MNETFDRAFEEISDKLGLKQQQIDIM